MNKLFIIYFLLVSILFHYDALAEQESYQIDYSHNDDKFLINDKMFEARGYCFDMEKGDEVIFVEGNPEICTTAGLYNKRTKKTCEVWCE